MPESGSWAHAQEYIRDSIKRLADKVEELEGEFKKMQIDCAAKTAAITVKVTIISAIIAIIATAAASAIFKHIFN